MLPQLFGEGEHIGDFEQVFTMNERAGDGFFSLKFTRFPPLVFFCSCTLTDRATVLWRCVVAIYHRLIGGWSRSHGRKLTFLSGF